MKPKYDINLDPFTFRSQTRDNVMFPEITKDIQARGLAAAQNAMRVMVQPGGLPKGMDGAEFIVSEVIFAVAPELAFRERAIFQEGLERQLLADGRMDPFDLLKRRGRP